MNEPPYSSLSFNSRDQLLAEAESRGWKNTFETGKDSSGASQNFDGASAAAIRFLSEQGFFVIYPGAAE